VLVDRFQKEMGHVVGRKETLKGNFAAVLARCFGDKVAEDWLHIQK